MTSIIAHRGASGYLPEHTLPAKALAYGMGADYLEQDVVASRDGVLIVLHDIYLDRVTDVAARYPDRARDDGRFYVRDFDLDELRELRVFERVDADGKAVFPGRFPAASGNFHLHTLGEELAFVAGLNKASGKTVGVYPEIKRPAWHRADGFDMTPAVLDTLSTAGYETADDPIFLQCFDAAELQRVRSEFGCRLKLVQLVGENSWREADTDYNHLTSPEGLQQLAKTVDGIGPWVELLYSLNSVDGVPVSTSVVEMAHDAGLLVHPYTFRADALATGFDSFAALVQYCAGSLGADGLFTDFPDLAREALSGIDV